MADLPVGLKQFPAPVACVQLVFGFSEGKPIVTGAHYLKAKPFTMAQMHRAYIIHVLEFAKGNKTQAARILGISRATMFRIAKEYDFVNAPTRERSVEPPTPNTARRVCSPRRQKRGTYGTIG